MIRYYADGHVARAVVDGLRRRGVDVATVVEMDALGDSDEAHLARAHRDGRVVFSQDTDFLRLAAAGVDHSGVVYARQGTAVGDLVRGLVRLVRTVGADEMAGRVEFL
ncbi:DUF5615 family PIN-like protein [Rubrivirga sp.]|uniref:DUF5615 family PIN-like protein n=1 Tax=Rubrivirga sp. TaxID=1885344 RepID=UPI003B525A65